jgi:hypothetical protein
MNGANRYYKITFTDQKVIVVTCLLVGDIENTLPPLLDIAAKENVRIICFAW